MINSTSCFHHKFITMKEPRSLPVRILRGLLQLALIVEVIAAVVVLATFTLTVFSEEDTLLSAWPVTLSEQPADVALTADDPTVYDLSLTVSQGVIRFSADTAAHYLLKLVDALLLFGVAITITVLLKRITNTLRASSPFVISNARRLRIIALLLIGLVPYDVLKGLVYRSFLMSRTSVISGEYISFFNGPSSSTENQPVWIDLPVDVQPLLIGLVLLVIAEVFRSGVLLRLDNESIV